MSTWHRPTEAGQQPTHETVPKDQSDSAVHEKTRPTGWDKPSQSQPRPTTLTCDEPSWHRLLGTLLSSQGTDAHPFRSFDLAGGNRSNLADRVFLVNLPCPGRSIGVEPRSRSGHSCRPVRVSPARSIRGIARGTSHRDRSSVSVPPCRATSRTLRSAGTEEQIRVR